MKGSRIHLKALHIVKTNKYMHSAFLKKIGNKQMKLRLHIAPGLLDLQQWPSVREMEAAATMVTLFFEGMVMTTYIIGWECWGWRRR